MSAADVVVKRLRKKGMTLSVDGGNILCQPGSELTEQDREMLRRNKGAILASLYRERFEAGVLKAMEPSDPRIQNLEAEVGRAGYVLLWSNVLEDLVAFCRNSEDADRVPRGVAAYTVDELAILFSEREDGPGIDGLKLIHHAKVLAGGHVRGGSDMSNK